MGLGSSSANWMTYVNFILDSMNTQGNIIAIMDDLLIHSTRQKHMELLECLFEIMIKNRLKLSPKKSQLFIKELVYLGTLFHIKGNNMNITHLCTRIEAIMNVPIPNTPRLCRSFCGMVNYISMFCPKLQEILKSYLLISN